MADNFHLLKEFIYLLYVWLHEVLVGAQGIFYALCGIFWVAVQTRCGSGAQELWHV